MRLFTSNFISPIKYLDYETDISIIIDINEPLNFIQEYRASDNTLLYTEILSIGLPALGLTRFRVGDNLSSYPQTSYIDVAVGDGTSIGAAVTEIKRYRVLKNDCNDGSDYSEVALRWLNNLAGYELFIFKTFSKNLAVSDTSLFRKYPERYNTVIDKKGVETLTLNTKVDKKELEGLKFLLMSRYVWIDDTFEKFKYYRVDNTTLIPVEISSSNLVLQEPKKELYEINIALKLPQLNA